MLTWIVIAVVVFLLPSLLRFVLSPRKRFTPLEKELEGLDTSCLDGGYFSPCRTVVYDDDGEYLASTTSGTVKTLSGLENIFQRKGTVSTVKIFDNNRSLIDTNRSFNGETYRKGFKLVFLINEEDEDDDGGEAWKTCQV